MDRLGFDVQVIYPTLFLIYLTDNVALEVALYRAYNRWLAEACAKGKERLRWVVIPPLRSIEESIKEIRWAKDRGAAGVFFRGIEGNLTLDNPYFFPVYQAASDLDLPICIHQGSGSPTFINFFNLDETANGPIPRFCRSLRSTTSSTIKSPSCFHVSNSASSKPTPVGFPICYIPLSVNFVASGSTRRARICFAIIEFMWRARRRKICQRWLIVSVKTIC
jgi:Amidohydrolase